MLSLSCLFILLKIMFSHLLQAPAEPAVQPEADDTYADIEDSESEEGITL